MRQRLRADRLQPARAQVVAAVRTLLRGPPAVNPRDALAAVVIGFAGMAASQTTVLLFVIACGLLILVRRLPVPVTIAIAALVTVNSNWVSLAYINAVGEPVMASPPVWPSVALVGAAGFLCGASAQLDWRLALPLLPCLFAMNSSLILLALGAGLGAGATWRSQRASGALVARTQELEEVTQFQRTQQIGLEERGQLARELHDIVGHHVTAVVVLAEAAQARGGDADGDLARIADTGRAALSELDTLVTALRDPQAGSERTAPRGLDSLPELLDHLQHAGLTAALHVEVRSELGQGLQLTAYRIVQESLTNVMRHANARRVRVAVVQRANVLALTVEDDGVGFDATEVKRGRGLVGIGERVQGHGGTWSVGASGLGGARVAVELPVSASSSPQSSAPSAAADQPVPT